jgi:hypothetical protein
MLGAWKCSCFDILGKVSCGGMKYRAQVGVLFDEARHTALTQTGHVLPDQYLSIALIASAYPDRWN